MELADKMRHTAEIARMRLSALTRRKTAADKAAKPKFEEIVVFDEDHEQIYRVALPRAVIADHLDSTARYLPDTQMPRYIGAAAGYGCMLFAMSVAFLFLLQWPLVAAVVMSVTLGVPGALPGWMLGPRFGPKPQWLAIRENGEIKRLPVEDYTEGDHPEASFAAELMQMRDLKFIYRGGASKVQRFILTSLLILLGSLLMAFFFMILIFTQ